MWFVVFCIRRSNRAKRSVGAAQRNNFLLQRHSYNTLPSIDMKFHTDCLPVTSPAKPESDHIVFCTLQSTAPTSSSDQAPLCGGGAGSSDMLCQFVFNVGSVISNVSRYVHPALIPALATVLM